MKPNNLVAILVVVILLAIGIALAIINQRAEANNPKTAPVSAHFTLPVRQYGASHYS